MGIFSGAMSVMMYLAAVISVSLVAKTFGTYAATFFPGGAPILLVDALAAAIILAFMFVNLNGARSAARIELVVVAVKIAVLIAFALIGLFYIQPSLLSPAEYPPISTVF